MRVVQIIDNLRFGGAQKMVSMLSKELLQRKVEVAVVSLDIEDEDAYYAGVLRDMNVEVKSIPGGRLLDINRIQGLLKFVRAGRFDVIQTHLSTSNMLGAFVGKITGLPVISTLHSTGVHRRYYNPLRLRLETLALKDRACQVVAVGYAVADLQKHRLGKQKNIMVIPNAMTAFPDLPHLEREKIRMSIAGSDACTLVITVGRLSPDKGYVDMITALSTIIRDDSSVFLLIVGDGPLSDALHDQVRVLGLEQNVVFLGSRDDVPLLLKSSDMYVSASYREGMSMSLLEAMAAGLPVIATNVGDASRMFTEDSGVLIEPGVPDLLSNSIKSLLSDPAKMQSMARAAYERLTTKFGLDAWANSYIDLYAQKIRKVNG